MINEPTGLTWRKSSYSSSSANCVEVATAGMNIAVRDSKDPGGPVLVYTPAAMRAFLAAVKAGEFDDAA